jgi:predicted flavoprotein YhiN
MIPVLVKLSGIPEEEKVNSITKQQRQKLVSLFKAFPVSISGPRPVFRGNNYIGRCERP